MNTQIHSLGLKHVMLNWKPNSSVLSEDPLPIYQTNIKEAIVKLVSWDKPTNKWMKRWTGERDQSIGLILLSYEQPSWERIYPSINKASESDGGTISHSFESWLICHLAIWMMSSSSSSSSSSLSGCACLVSSRLRKSAEAVTIDRGRILQISSKISTLGATGLSFSISNTPVRLGGTAEWFQHKLKMSIYVPSLHAPDWLSSAVLLKKGTEIYTVYTVSTLWLLIPVHPELRSSSHINKLLNCQKTAWRK